MNAWAGIESKPQPSPALPSEPHTVAARPKPPARLRRQQRPVVGSIDAAGAMLQHNGREVVVGAALIVLPGVVLTLVANVAHIRSL